jgi:hypothetical protein
MKNCPEFCTALPEIATAEQVAAYLKLTPKTVQNTASKGEFIPGIYIGRNRYNMSRLVECITHPPYRYTIDTRSPDYCRDMEA